MTAAGAPGPETPRIDARPPSRPPVEREPPLEPRSTPAAALGAPPTAVGGTGTPVAEPGDAPGLWAAVEARGRERGSLRPLLEQMRVESWIDDRVIVLVGPRVLGLAQRSAEALAELFSSAAGRALTLDLRPGADVSPVPPSPVAQRVAGAANAAAAADAAAAREHPVVKKAVELFGARIVRVKPRRPQEATDRPNP